MLREEERNVLISPWKNVKRKSTHKKGKTSVLHCASCLIIFVIGVVTGILFEYNLMVSSFIDFGTDNAITASSQRNPNQLETFIVSEKDCPICPTLPESEMSLRKPLEQTESSNDERIIKFAKRVYVYVSVYERSLLVNLMAASFYRSKYSKHVNLFILDDGSHAFNESALALWFPTATLIPKARHMSADYLDNKKHHLFLNHTSRTSYHLRRDPFYVDIPSDVVVGENWLVKLFTIAKKSSVDLSKNMLTLYNSPHHATVANHSDHKDANGIPFGLVEKADVGFTGTIFKKPLLEMYLKSVVNTHQYLKKYDVRMSGWMKQQSFGMLALNPSVLQHTGAFSGKHPYMGEWVKNYGQDIAISDDIYLAINLISSVPLVLNPNDDLNYNCNIFSRPSKEYGYVLLNIQNFKNCIEMRDEGVLYKLNKMKSRSKNKKGVCLAYY